MLWTIAVICLIIWALGLGGVFTFGAGALGYLIHIFLVVALIVIVLQLLSGRRAP